MNQNNGFTAVQNNMQKMMALLNWLNFVSEFTLVSQQGTRRANAHSSPYPLRQI